MKRKIKFRGKARNILYNGAEILHHKGDWLYGDLIHQDGETFVCPVNTRYPRGTSFTSFVVFDGSVGQFTGLKDNRANDIYEGDILSDEDGTFVKVIFFSGCFGFIYPDQEPDRRYFYKFYDSALETKDITVVPFEIVGNIHDNLELLKGGSNE